jgi:hypothetical protein
VINGGFSRTLLYRVIIIIIIIITITTTTTTTTTTVAKLYVIVITGNSHVTHLKAIKFFFEYRRIFL